MPEWKASIRERLSTLRLAPEREAAIVEEIALHLDDRYREMIASGLEEPAAEAAAWRELEDENVLARGLTLSERSRLAELPPPGAPARGRWAHALWQDIRHAARTLRQQPTFALTVILALALTIGPTTAIVSVVNWMFWRPLPGAAHADRLALVWFGRFRPDGVTVSRPSYPNVDDIRRSLTTADGFAGASEIQASLSLLDVPARRIELGQVTHDFFDVAGVSIVAGRSFLPADDLSANPPPVALVSHRFAEGTFGSAAAALDQPLTLNRKPFRVVGVVAPEFRGIQPLSTVDVWTTGGTAAYLRDSRATDLSSSRTLRGPFFSFVARIAPGRTPQEFQAELDARVRGLADAFPKENAEYTQVIARAFPRLSMEPLAQADMWRTTKILLVIAGVVLLLGCANAANVLIARAIRRAPEIAVRKALGASRSRLLQMELVESCVLALAGSALGVLLSLWMKQVMQVWMFRSPAAAAAAIPIDWRVLIVTTGAALAVGVLAGIAPAWLTRRSPPNASVLRAGAGRTATRAPKLRSGLAVAQLALSLSLLIGAFMLVATLQHLNGAALGFDPAGLVFTRVSLVGQGYGPERTGEYQRAAQYQRALVEQLERSFPGNAAVSFFSPTDTPGNMLVRDPSGGKETRALIGVVSDTYFATLRVPLLRGRTFTREEAFAPVAPNPVPVVIGATFARELFGPADPVGRMLQQVGTRSVTSWLVIGVAGDVRNGGLDSGRPAAIHLPIGSFELAGSQVTAIVRGPGSGDAAQDIRRAAARVDPAVPVGDVDSVSIVLQRSIRLQNLFARVLSWLGALAAVLAAVGLYGLVAQSTAERAREFGIRLAIGASRASIARLVARSVLVIAILGSTLGLVLARLGTPLLKSLLAGVTELDVSIYAAATGALAIVVLVAAAWPAFRATRVQPVDVLRAE
jgi:predicted permease